ncbi:MAG: sugar phosphate isomerase/epimerase family protein [Armatimonadota bacterium]|nr:sugar phosphate isomerase/epimerase family protein [Armatimonadota bacterium]
MYRPLGISSTMLDQQLTAENLREARSRGITHLEVYVARDEALFADDEEVRRLAERAGEAGMSLWSVHAPFGAEVDLSTPDELARRRAVGEVRRACEVGAALGAKYVVVHAGLSAEDEEEHELRARQSVRSINCLLKRASQLGVRVALEYLPANKPRLCNNSVELLECLRLCDGDACVCLDTNHANLSEPLDIAMRTLGGSIETLHISDNDGHQERHTLPGRGVIDWGQFMALLDEIDYKGPLLLEATGGESVPDLVEKSVAAARQYLNWEGPDV